MYPVSIRVVGTAISTPIIPDTFQNPFAIGIGVVAANCTYSVQHCFDYTAVMSPTWNGTTATWMDNSGITNTSLATVNGNYAFPVAAIRLNVTGAANATAAATMMLIQAQNAP